LCAKNKSGSFLEVWELVLFSMMGTMMFSAQFVMELLPNIHLTGMFIVLFTVVFRKKALIPLTLYIFLCGIRWSFSLTWLPYLYIWFPLWAGTMLVPTKAPRPLKAFLYCLLGLIHGLSYGVLYAPVQALLFRLNWNQTLLWIAHGFPWDIAHGVGNLFACTLVLPLASLMEKLVGRIAHRGRV
jgi:energy-coupling factor transport system substrate-specific component